jgi:hypothetical protein
MGDDFRRLAKRIRRVDDPQSAQLHSVGVHWWSNRYVRAEFQSQ